MRAPASPSVSLRALTVAAMALPGIAQGVEVEDAQIQYGRYEEGGRTFWDGPEDNLKEPEPINVDSLHAGFGLRLTDRLKAAFSYLQDTWSGATPILTTAEGFLTVSGASAYPAGDSRTDRELVPYGVSPNGVRVPQPKLIHMMTGASAETRRQFDLDLSHEWDRFALGVGVGMSDEPDFMSRFVRANARFDFNQKLTSVQVGASHTDSSIDAKLGAPTDWIDYGLYLDADSGPSISRRLEDGQEVQHFKGDRDDWSANLGLTQVLGRNTTFSAGAAYARDSGFLESPYKLVSLAFSDPNTPPFLFQGLLLTRLYNVAENRPDERTQWSWYANLSQYFPGPHAALHLHYGHAQDDWGIRSHTFEAAWSQPLGSRWLLTPRLRYYSQSEADFYQPYFIFEQSAPVNPDGTLDFGRVPLEHYASDHRLSGYGAASAGITLARQFARGVSLEAGVEHYVHAGGLKLGGGGEGGYADFDYWMFNLAVAVDFTAAPASVAPVAVVAGGASDTPHAHDAAAPEHAAHGSHAGALAPAGLMNAHMLGGKGDFMLGYHFMSSRQSGDMLHGTERASDARILSQGCAVECSVVPEEMTMRMHMVHAMYAPRDWLNLTASFQFMDMDMDMRPLEGTVTSGGGGHSHGGHHHHATAGVGDTSVAALVRLLATPGHALHLGLGLSLPTGAVDEKATDGEFLDYGMQLGSGTFDLQPSLTYNGAHRRWFWGAQVGAAVRMQEDNESGYALGDLLQSSAWAGYSAAPWVAFSLRTTYTAQGEIEGRFNGPQMQMGPMDFPENYGGRFVDLGLGVSFAVPGRLAAGDRIAIEWVEPVYDDFNGYQLERSSGLSVHWSIMF